MNKTVKQLLAFLCSVVCLLSCSNLALTVFGSDRETGAETDGQTGQINYGYSARFFLDSADPLFTDVTVAKTDGSGDRTFTAGESVEVRMNFKADSLRAGDKTVITLPNELVLVSAPDFDLRNSAGITIATASIDVSQNTITITFNDKVEGLSNISGQLTYTARIASVDAGDYELKFKEDEVETLLYHITVEKGSDVDYNKIMHKRGSLQTDGTVKWTIYVNFDQKRRLNAVLVDELNPGHTLVDGSVVVSICNTLEVEGSKVDYKLTDITDEIGVQYAADGFTVEFGEISSGYVITCTTVISDLSVKTYKNTATLHYGTTSWSNWWGTVYWNFGGNATGDYSGRLKVVKRDAKTGELLPEASFHLLDGNETIIAKLTTGQDGAASVEDLELGADYYLVETQPPRGYEAGGEKILVEITSSDELELTVTNRKVSAEPDPDPTPNPDPEPNPTPDPDPKPEPTPDPVPAPDPDPGLISKPDAKPNPDPAPNPDPGPEPIPDPAPKPDPDKSKTARRSGGGTDQPDRDRTTGSAPPAMDEMQPDAEEGQAESAPAAGQPGTGNPETGSASTALSLVTALASLGGAVLLLRDEEED